MIYCIGMSVVPHEWRPPPLTVERYHQMVRAGVLTTDDPVELLEEALVRKLPKSSQHSSCTQLARRAIQDLLPEGWHYQSHDPVTLADGEPEPDGAVVRGQIEDYELAHPGPAAIGLVIEVADTSLSRDRGIKLRSYARAGIFAYWIINLVDRVIESYLGPDPNATPEPTYTQPRVYRAGEAVPLVLPGVGQVGAVPVAKLLPAAE
jgi:Uma2 family endonuclease